MKKITEYEKKQCVKCKYRTNLSGEAVCNFLEITGNRRPSPVGEPCQEYEKRQATSSYEKEKNSQLSQGSQKSTYQAQAEKLL